MQRKVVTEYGECRASIKTEEEIATIRMELVGAAWLSPTLRWVEAIKDPTRFQIVYLLYRYHQLCVCDLANILNISSSAVSQHFRKLKDMEIVSTTRVKQTIFYRLENEVFVSFFTGLLPEGSSEKEVLEEMSAHV